MQDARPATKRRRPWPASTARFCRRAVLAKPRPCRSSLLPGTAPGLPQYAFAGRQAVLAEPRPCRTSLLQSTATGLPQQLTFAGGQCLLSPDPAAHLCCQAASLACLHPSPLLPGGAPDRLRLSHADPGEGPGRQAPRRPAHICVWHEHDRLISAGHGSGRAAPCCAGRGPVVKQMCVRVRRAAHMYVSAGVRVCVGHVAYMYTCAGVSACA